VGELFLDLYALTLHEQIVGVAWALGHERRFAGSGLRDWTQLYWR
jgi:hypothetical protein